MTSTIDDLTRAAEKGDLEDVNALLAEGIDPNQNSPNHWRLTPLAAAASPGFDSDYPGDRLGTVQALLSAGADVNFKGIERAPLMMSSYGKDLAITQTLLDAGASISDTNDEGHSALTVAAQHGTAEQIRILLAAGADPNQQPDYEEGRTALGLAIETTRKREATDQEGAAKVRALLEGGAQVDHQDADGDTALHWASYHDLPAITQALLDHGADITLVNRKGITAEEDGRGESQKMIMAHRERQALREAAGLTDEPEPVQRARRM